MKRIGVCLVAVCMLGLVGCTTNVAKKPEKPQPAIQAPGIDELKKLMQKADIFYQTQDYGQAKDVYTEITRLDKKNLKAQYRLGNIAFRGRDWQEAVKRYQIVITLEPRHTRAQYNLAMTHLTLAERHLKFYAANVDGSANLEAVGRLVTALEEISNPGASRRSQPRATEPATEGASSLDLLLDELAR